MKKVKFIDFKDKKILHVNFSGCDEKEVIGCIEEAKKIIRSQPEKSTLVLTNVDQAKYNNKVVEALKDFTTGNKPYVKASAITGLSRIKKIVFNAVTEASARSIVQFDDEKKAKEWLATQ